MSKIETTGILENPDGFLWLVGSMQGYVSLGIEEFEGRLVKVTRTQDKIIIEIIREPIEEVEPATWATVPVRTRELCRAGG